MCRTDDRDWHLDDPDFCQCNKIKTKRVVKKGIIYILGPMRGVGKLNFHEFNKWAKRLRMQGWTVFNPAETIADLKSPKAYIMLDIAVVAECDAVFRLKNWENSKGARVENALADFLDLEIIDEV